MKKTRAELSGIYKIYETENNQTGEVYKNAALTNVNIEFYTSEIHALLGENGAGKSTLVNIFSGLLSPTKGSIKIANKVFNFNSPNDALNAGVAIVHQRPRLAANASVFENIMIGTKHKRFLSLINLHSEKQKIETLKSKWNLDLNLNAKIKNLSADKRFYTAMFSALYTNPQFLILDEPASVFTDKERQTFFSVLKKTCTEEKIGVILITHKVEEALNFADRISVLKNGKMQGSFLTEDLGTDDEAELFIKKQIFSGDKFLKGKKEKSHDKNMEEKKSDYGFEFCISFNSGFGSEIKKFQVKAERGKITGLVGFPNSVIEYLEDILSGMAMGKSNDINKRYYTGSIVIENPGTEKKVFSCEKITPSLLLKNKIGFIPSDRNLRGADANLSIEEVLNCYRFKNNFFDKKKSDEFILSLLKTENIAADKNRLAGTLSGGQLQRLILARCLAENPEIIIAAEPAWGLDLLSTELLMNKFRALAEQGRTIIILTKEFDTASYKNAFDAVYFLGKEN
ncbi:ATP-binding cassette domain-containing protein [Treponema denticola]|uniref:ATP-binding cassette domain-containing protein n=1 Tax=Treponema denticola TaxID=158 RepID=UPI0020A3A7D6|nr:ATP-binding cassette domain-containing protein [Treponema denticola]UTC81981.1 ATP-binding cassette domain-containing protein [Treponema denticola]